MFRCCVLVMCFGFMLSSSIAEDEEETTLLVLDSMVNMMLGEGQYDREYYTQLRSCMESMDVQLPQVSDGAWQGMIDYWDLGGGENDAWGSAGSLYMEKNATVTNIHGMVIYEPCDYTSNVAYYHPATEICTRLDSLRTFDLPLEFIQSFVRGYTNLGMGSSFMHGSNTGLGGLEDVRTLAALAYQIHQASLASIPRNPILHDISLTLRDKTAFELITDLSDMFLNIPVEEWNEHTLNLDIPDYYLVYTAIFTGVLDIAFEPEFVDPLIPILAGQFGVSQDIVDFIINSYLPELRKYTEKLNLNSIERARFIGNGIGTAGKFIYAFLWQEDVLTDNPIFTSEEANAIGWALLPKVNDFLGKLQTFPYYEKTFQSGENVYPGDFNCNPVIPHAKWHLQSAIGMLDLTYLADEMYAILSEVS